MRISQILSVAALSSIVVGCVDDPVRPITPTRSVDLVPVVAPDSVPSDMYDSANIIENTNYMTGAYLKNIVVIFFNPDATQQQRQDAVDKVSGAVVGGLRIGNDGMYYVQIAGDNTGAAVSAARDSLNALPQVRAAVYELFSEGSGDYRKPNDGGIYQAQNWDARAGLIGGSNVRWGLEAAALPLAWGCETGSANTALAIVDFGFHNTIPDLSTAQIHNEVLNVPGWRHGDEVASVAAATGDNGRGITGAMWRSSLHLYEIGDGTRIRYLIDRIRQAGNMGVPIINLSIGIKWPSAALTRIQNNVPTSQDSILRTEFDTRLQQVMALLADAGKRPLLVTSAGNNDIDAFWNGKSAVLDSFPDRVLVVANATNVYSVIERGHLSNWGRIVEIGAPGDYVGALNDSMPDTPMQNSGGTSLSAAMVSGVAGLLLSFEPSLSAAQLKDAIMEGARRGGRTIHAGATKAPIPFLNAYESLKYVAETPGRRLCGNEVWAANSRIFARHGTVATQLFTIGTTTRAVTDLSVSHGGTEIQYNAITDAGDTLPRAKKFSNGSWVNSTKYDLLNPPAGYYSGGTGLSARFVSHDRNYTGQVENSLTAVPGQEHVFVSWNGSPTEIPVRDFNVGPAGRQGGCASYKVPSGCDRQYDHPPTEGVWTSVGAISPQHRFMLVAINRRIATSVNLAATITSTDDDGGTRYTYPEVYEWQSTGSYIYRVDLDNPAQIVHVGTIPDVTIYWLGISEDDSRVIFGMGHERRTEMYTGTREPAEWSGAERVLTGCAVHFRLADLRVRTFPIKATDYACPAPQPNQPGGNGTVSPQQIDDP